MNDNSVEYHDNVYELVEGEYKTEEEYEKAAYNAWCKKEFGTANQYVIDFCLIMIAGVSVIVAGTYYVLSKILKVVFGEE
jgi:hypothetical protein